MSCAGAWKPLYILLCVYVAGSKGVLIYFLRVFHVPFEEVGVHSLVAIINIPLRMLTFPLRLLRKQVERPPTPAVRDPTELAPEPELAFGLSLPSPWFISS